MHIPNLSTYPTAQLDPTRKTGLILCGMGGPDGPDAVQPFLRNLFADPAILPVPRWISPLLGLIISKRRAPEVTKRYLQVSPDGVTPQLGTTLAQAEAVAELLNDGSDKFVAGMAMRYWRPYPDECLEKLVAQGAEQFVVVPTYPQYSCATNGSTLQFVQEAMKRLAPGCPVYMMHEWPLLPGLIDVFSEGGSQALQGFAGQDLDPSTCALLYVAHSLPQKMIDRGDPYLNQTQQTVDAVHEKIRAGLIENGHGDWFGRITGGYEPSLAFQSRVGPIKWLGPEIVSTVKELAQQGCQHLHVQPVSFTCEHIETVMELDIELKADAKAAGIQTFSRGSALNLDERWLSSLAQTILQNAFLSEVSAS